MALEVDVEPSRSHRDVVDVVLVDPSVDLYETVELAADDARLLGLKLIRAADAAESMTRRGW